MDDLSTLEETDYSYDDGDFNDDDDDEHDDEDHILDTFNDDLDVGLEGVELIYIENDYSNENDVQEEFRSISVLEKIDNDSAEEVILNSMKHL